MLRPLRVFLAAAVLTTLSTRGRAWSLPPLEGQLSGDVLPTLLTNAPKLHWRVTVQRVDGKGRHLLIEVDGEGTTLRAEATVGVMTSDGEWKLTDAEIDVARWNAAAVGVAGSSAANLVGTGTIKLTGSGVLRNGVPSGEIAIALREGTLRNPIDAWTLEGVTLEGRYAFDAATQSVRSVTPAKVVVHKITTKRFGAQNLTAHGDLQDLKTFQLRGARVEIAGGDVVVAPTTVHLDPFEVRVEVTINRIGLQDVAALVPTVVSAARGRVDGAATMGWSKAAGLSIGNARLSLRADEPAEVTLKPTPGLITSSLPAKVLEAYPGLEEVELGQAAIRAQTLEVTFTPNTDAEGRTAVVHLMGVPKHPRARAPIDLNVNVRGPLKPFIELGTSTKFSLGLK